MKDDGGGYGCPIRRNTTVTGKLLPPANKARLREAAGGHGLPIQRETAATGELLPLANDVGPSSSPPTLSPSWRPEAGSRLSGSPSTSGGERHPFHGGRRARPLPRGGSSRLAAGRVPVARRLMAFA